MEQEVIIANTDLLVLKQWNDALIRIMPSLLGLLTKNNRALRARSLFKECIGVRAGGARGAAAPPNYGQLRFFGQQEKIWAKPVFKNISMLLYYFEEINIFYFNLKLA